MWTRVLLYAPFSETEYCLPHIGLQKDCTIAISKTKYVKTWLLEITVHIKSVWKHIGYVKRPKQPLGDYKPQPKCLNKNCTNPAILTEIVDIIGFSKNIKIIAQNQRTVKTNVFNHYLLVYNCLSWLHVPHIDYWAQLQIDFDIAVCLPNAKNPLVPVFWKNMGL